jgi:hypothetical protein
MPPTHDKTGRARKSSGDVWLPPNTTTTRVYRRSKIRGPFAARLIDMLESPAYRVLSLSAHRVLARLEIEFARHGGRDNGRLPVTYEDFQEYGIDRHAIAPAIRECEALGFLEVTERGHAGNAEFRSPNKFRLTYRHTDNAGATDEWQRIKIIEEALELARSARSASPQRKKRSFRRTPLDAPSKKQKPSGGKHHVSVGKSPPERAATQWGKPTLQS